MIKAIIFLIVGFLLLVKGADFFVESASSIAKRLRIPSFVIGLTIVAFGTSAPELAVSLSAALKGSNDIAIGNVVGSNIFNILVVLGASAAISPIAVEKGLIKKDYPLSIFGVILLGLLSIDTFLFKSPSMKLGHIDGLILLLVFAFFMYTTLREGFKKRATTPQNDESNLPKWSIGTSIIILIVGLAGIILGGNLSVDGAKEIARALGLSEALIGLTIVAIGTSLPELVTSIVAARKDESDIAVGNVIGSNIFNIFFILGTSAAISPMNVTDSYLYDILVLLVISIVSFIPIAKTKKVNRSLGLIMLFAYVAYTAYLIMR